MLHFEYSKWVPEPDEQKNKLDELMNIFSYILIQTNGNVEEALDWMKF